MVDIWETLSPERRALLDNLSGDLFMLVGDEVLEVGEDPDRSKAAFDDAWNRRDWIALLALLRRSELRARVSDDCAPYVGLSENRVANMRAQCWRELGFREAANCFVEYARSLKMLEFLPWPTSRRREDIQLCKRQLIIQADALRAASDLDSWDLMLAYACDRGAAQWEHWLLTNVPASPEEQELTARSALTLAERESYWVATMIHGLRP
jgi:hypothetical protein